MLTDFFKLDAPYDEATEDGMRGRVATKLVVNVLYRPDSWPRQAPKIDNVTFRNVSLSKTTIRDVTFNDCVFEDCLFIGTDFADVEFHSCKFKNCNFFRSKFEGVYIDPATIEFGRQCKKNYSNIGVRLYQALYENASAQRQARRAIFADIEFRRWLRLQLSYDLSKNKISRGEYFAQYAASVFYECIAGFGYRPSRFILATLALFTTFSALNMYFLSGALARDGHPISNMSFPDGVYFTYSMLTALGFSTITPTTALAKVVAVGEALFGIGWLGIFTSLLVKRFIK